MKKLLYTTFLLSILTLTGCFKDYEKRYLFTDNRVEFEDAVINPNSSGVTFPWLTPLANDVGVVRYRVNMTGDQASEDRTINFRLQPDRTTAVEGVDFRLPHGTSFVIPANSSFGWIEIEVLPDGSGSPRIVLELLPTDDINVMDRYHQIGLQILFPSTPPPSVEDINDIRYFDNITFGAHSNPSVGHYMDLHTGYAYIRAGADVNEEKIDIIVLRSSAGTEQNVMVPASGGVTAWPGSTGHIPAEWSVRNTGELMFIPSPSTADMDLFENAQSKADLEAAYQYYFDNIQGIAGYNVTNHGPGLRVRPVETGGILAFRSNSRDVISIMYVTEVVPGTTGHIRGNLKSGGEGQ